MNLVRGRRKWWNGYSKFSRKIAIELLFEALRGDFNKTETETNHSLHEQIIPVKTKKSGVCQNNLKKSHKWGVKNLVRAGQSEIIYDFFLYRGKISTGGNSCSADASIKIVRRNTTKSGVQTLFWQLVFYIRLNGPA